MNEILAEIKRVEANMSIRETLAKNKRKKAEYRKEWQTIHALRLHLERKYNAVEKSDTTSRTSADANG